MINDFVTVTMNLTGTAMRHQSLGSVVSSSAGGKDEHSLREPAAHDATTPLGEVHMSLRR